MKTDFIYLLPVLWGTPFYHANRCSIKPPRLGQIERQIMHLQDMIIAEATLAKKE